MVIDETTQMIYTMAAAGTMNSWLRTLAQIRTATQTWPMRWSSKDET